MKNVTLADIRNHMIKFLSAPYDKNSEELYDDCGHCGDGLYRQIVMFWESFTTNKDFLFVVSGEYAGELDLDGGRNYLLEFSNVKDLLYNYMYYTLNIKTKEEFKKITYNSTTFVDELGDMFTEETSKVLQQSNKNEYNHNVKIEESQYGWILIKYPMKLKGLADLQEELEFVDFSKIDNDPIYKMKVLKGGTVIQSLEYYIK